MAAGAVSLRKSHDIEILSFCNIVKGQANKVPVFIQIQFLKKSYILKNYQLFLMNIQNSMVQHE